MKTKFDSVVKIKKQQVEKIENDIQKINSSIKELQNKIEELNKQFSSFSLPDKGTFAHISQIKLQQNLLKNEIENLSSQINMLNARKNDLLNELKKAHMDYEKMKYLQAEELKKKVKEMRLKEAREMDEIAILLRNQSESR